MIAIVIVIGPHPIPQSLRHLTGSLTTCLDPEGGYRHHSGMRAAYKFRGETHACAYLPDQLCTLEYTVPYEISGQEYEDLMNRGYRKFGRFLFRPVCAACSACRPIRIPVAEFRPDRSQRRAWKRNEHLEVRYARPGLDDQRLDLYRRYHAAQANRKGWPETEKEAEDYATSFVDSPIPSVEISLWEEDRLRAVVLTDVTPNVVSGVYHFYDPELYPQSVGTYCMLQTLELARRLNRKWAYFGFYVAGCGSLEYKARFHPCEVMDERGHWHPFAREASRAPGTGGVGEFGEPE